MKRLMPVFLLFVLSPLVAEFLSGSTSLAQIGAMLVFLPLYGLGAILVREIARRTGRGWLAMPFLALAYALIEEGFVLQTLFNPNFMGAHLIDVGFVPALGIGAPWTAYVLGIHVLWSILVPVALTEMLFRNRRNEPWLGRIGLGIVALLFVALAATLTFGMAAQTHFSATSARHVGLALIIVFAAGLAFSLPVSRPSVSAAPRPWIVGLSAFFAGSAFLLLYSQGIIVLHWPWQWVTGGLVAILLALLASGRAAARCTGWTDRHRFAATAGGMLVYCWFGFVTDISLHGTASLGAHAALAAATIALVAFAGLRTYRIIPPEKQ